MKNKTALIITGVFVVLALFIAGCIQDKTDDKLQKEYVSETITTEILPNVPWSAYYMHVENIDAYNQCFDEIIALADTYNTPLTLLLWPQIRDRILDDPVEMKKMNQWIANGHEIGIHVQGCWGDSYCATKGECLKEGDAEKYLKLYKGMKTAHATPAKFGAEEYRCPELLPESIRYGGARRFDGRNAISTRYTIDGRTFDILNVKAGYVDPDQQKLAQYETLKPNEIYFTGNHAECDFEYLKEWFKYLSKKDPEGKKRKTQTWLMENIILPENRSISAEELRNPDNKCSILVGGNVFSDDWGFSPTDVFNFGRCIADGSFCYYDEKCSEGNCYVPTQCSLGTIDNADKYKPASETCVIKCGDKSCDIGENRIDSPIYCPEDCEKKKK